MTWDPPSQPKSAITGYQVIYSIYENETNVSSNVLSRSDRSYLIRSLGKKIIMCHLRLRLCLCYTVPGIPYQVIVVAFSRVSRRGVGIFKPFFSQELTVTKIPENLAFKRTSRTSVNISWTPLTLFEARGFPEYRVSVTLSSDGGNSKRQSIPAMITTNESYVVLNNLDSDKIYSVIIGVRTGASIEFKDADPIIGTYGV